MGPKSPHNLAWPGGVLTAAYLIFVGVYALAQRDALLAMDPNEFGDFLAGSFAPLAFLWLVLGFFQQGQELRNSVAALQLQGEELRHSVEQQRQLVEVTREQLGLDRALQDAAAQADAIRLAPVFQLSGGVSSWSSPILTHRFYIINVGADCRQVCLDCGTGTLKKVALLGKGERLEFGYQWNKGDDVPRRTLTLSCVDVRGKTLIFQYQLKRTEGKYGLEYQIDDDDQLFSFVDV